jgi:hypothetical protein
VQSTGALSVATTGTVTGNMSFGGNAILTGYINESAASGLAAAGSNVATGLVLSHQVNQFGTVTTGKGAVLPAITTCGIGTVVRVINGGAGTLSVYGGASDTIDGTAAATGVLLSNAKSADFSAVAAATWVSNLLGATSA